MKQSLDIKKFNKGECFICGLKDNIPNWAYCHYACAVSYLDEKDKRIKESSNE